MPANTANNPEPARSSSLWWWVIGAFVLLIAAWTMLIKVASSHRPEVVPLAPATEEASAATDPAP